MEWYEILNTCTNILILCTLVSVVFVVFTEEYFTKKSKEQKDEKPKENERKQITKVVIFYDDSTLIHWFDLIGIKLFSMDIKCDIYRGLRRIEIGNTKIYFMTNYEINGTWFTLQKDTLYYLSASYDLGANFDMAFQSIVFEKKELL